MKNCVSVFCLLIYLLFGFFNTGCVGFCAGTEVSHHFGLNLFGYETCCHHNKEISNSSLIDITPSNQVFKTCKCNDIFVQTSDIVQAFDNQSFDFSNINIYTKYPQIIAYYINSLSANNIYYNDVFFDFERLKRKSTVLRI